MEIKILSVGPFQTNCYVVGSTAANRGLIIDPGADASGILGVVKRLGWSISTIVLTHAHMDHFGALKQVREATGGSFAIHEDETKMLSGNLNRILAQMGSSPADLPAQPERLLKENDLVGEADFMLKVLHTPGHSPGGICLQGDGIVFSGDTLFNMGVGRTDFPGCSEELLYKSIENKLMKLPDDTVVYPGHGPSTTIGNERRGNPFIR